MRSSFRTRARILSALFIIGAAVILVRLYFLQVVHGSEYRTQALQQYVESSPEAENRGSIFFTDRNDTLVAGAIMQAGWRVAINPEELADPDRTHDALSAIVKLDRERFFKSAAKKNDPYEEVAFRLTDSEASRVRALKMKGVLVIQDRWRMYPGGERAAHALGFVGYAGNMRVGRYGLERYWEPTLARSGSGLYVNPFAEIFANVQTLFMSDPAAAQGDIITTIEPKAQEYLEDTLDSVMRTYSPKLSGGIIMNPKTGAIIAIAARPTFDPNTFNTAPNNAVFSNPSIESVFEMGSIMKPLSMAAGIDSGAVTANTTYYDPGCIEKSGKKICNYDGKARKTVSMQEVLNQSLNTGVSFVVDTMGQKAFGTYMSAYAFGEKSGIDLPNEVEGIVSGLESGSDVDYASAAFGQGIAVTPIAMIRALAVLPNDGALPSPHVVRAIRYETGLMRAVEQEPARTVLKKETAEEVTRMLVQVFDKALLNGALKQQHYSIAAKTGTAQIARPGGGGYYEDRYLHSFFGYFPAHDAQFIVLLYTVEPKGVRYASETLARPFLDVAKFLINYFKVAPDR